MVEPSCETIAEICFWLEALLLWFFYIRVRIWKGGVIYLEYLHFVSVEGYFVLELLDSAEEGHVGQVNSGVELFVVQIRVV